VHQARLTTSSPHLGALPLEIWQFDTPDFMSGEIHLQATHYPNASEIPQTLGPGVFSFNLRTPKEIQGILVVPKPTRFRPTPIGFSLPPAPPAECRPLAASFYSPLFCTAARKVRPREGLGRSGRCDTEVLSLKNNRCGIDFHRRRHFRKSLSI
jgi:hypothetical protein